MATTFIVYIKIKKQYYRVVMLCRFVGTVDANFICKSLANN